MAFFSQKFNFVFGLGISVMREILIYFNFNFKKYKDKQPNIRINYNKS